VRLTGNYGGEVLRQVRAFKVTEPHPGLFRPELLPSIRQASDTYATITQGHPVSFAAFRQGPWHHYGLLALEQTQLRVRSPYLDNDFVKTVFQAPAATLRSEDLCLRIIADGDRTLRRIRTDRGQGGDARSVSAAAARTFLEFLFKAEYAYDYGMPQWLAALDHTLSGLRLERLFLGRHKFYHFRSWYRDALAGYVKDVLLDPGHLARPYLHRETVQDIVERHLEGTRNYTGEIHKLLTLELLHRSLIDT